MPSRGPIEICRDEWGIPHVFAQSRAGAWFGQGYAHATDRLWQLVYDRFKAQGRSAELIGQKGVTHDAFVRRLGLIAAAEADEALLTADERAMFESYAAGINRAVADGATAHEFELLERVPEPWTVTDCLAVWKVRHVLMGSKGTKLWRERLRRALGADAMRRLATPEGREDLLIVPPGATERWAGIADGPIEGSNSWALDGSRTASGAPILAGDPHRLLETPNVYVQMQLACDAFDVVGLTIPGVPGFPHFGHNGEVAWCITHAMADDQDLFLERFDATGRVENVDGWSEPRRHRETILVHGDDPIEIEITRTDRGPIVFGDPGTGDAISIRWTGIDEPRRGLACLGRMLETRTAAEMDEAMREWVFPCNSMLIADRDEIRYLHRGRVPIRPRGNALLPVDPSHAWQGDVPFEDLPRIVKPETGWIATANNRIISSRYPHHLGMDYAAPNRQRRIVEHLEHAKDARVEDMAPIHRDTISIASRVFLDALCDIEMPAEPLTLEAFVLLQRFDADMRLDSPGATILMEARDAFLELLTASEPLHALKQNPFPEEPLVPSPEARLRSALPRVLTRPDPELERRLFGGRDRNTLLAEALAIATQRLEQRFGRDPSAWTYDKVHRTEVHHPLSRRFPEANLDPPSVAIAGDGDTVQVAAAEIGYGVYHASVARYVFDLADRNDSAWIVPLGASGDHRDAHAFDQQERWAAGELIPIITDRSQLKLDRTLEDQG